MPNFEPAFLRIVDEVVTSSALVATRAELTGQLTDSQLIAVQGRIAAARRNIDAAASLLASETAIRSARQNGLSGLAQKEGFRTPEALVRHATGGTTKEAAALIRVGGMMHDSLDITQSADATPKQEPWLVAVGSAVVTGALSVAGADAIRNGLGKPTEGISPEALASAAASLISGIAEAAHPLGSDGCLSDPDELYRRARDVREELDAASIATRERSNRQQRSFRRWRKPDGMTRYTWELDPEGAALVDGIYDQITSPRRGGPRMVDKEEAERAAAVERDTRTTDQIASDGMLQLLTLAVGTDPQKIIGRAQPAVRVLVDARDLANRSGHGRIEGQNGSISIETVERMACSSGIVPIIFDEHGQAIDVGREQRLFTRRQRIALAARDGGCRWPGCERPPAWAEAHHVEHWKRDGGKTDLQNGILLCRHHHLLLHDNQWEIQRRDEDYWLIPPASIDRNRTPRPMPSKSAALHDLLNRKVG